jgi:hypothetical protein
VIDIPDKDKPELQSIIAFVQDKVDNEENTYTLVEVGKLMNILKKSRQEIISELNSLGLNSKLNL